AMSPFFFTRTPPIRTRRIGRPPDSKRSSQNGPKQRSSINSTRASSIREGTAEELWSAARCARVTESNPDGFIQKAIDRYDGEVLHNDWRLEQLVGKLKQLGILDNTLIIVVSDHGKEFWEHGWTAHGQ